jgi:hypothetical protein
VGPNDKASDLQPEAKWGKIILMMMMQREAVMVAVMVAETDAEVEVEVEAVVWGEWAM